MSELSRQPPKVIAQQPSLFMNPGKSTFISFFLFVTVLFGAANPAPGLTFFGIATTNNLSILYWSSPAGINGVVQSSGSVTSPNWFNATDAVPFNYGPDLAATVTNSAQARYFRLWLVPPTSEG